MELLGLFVGSERHCHYCGCDPTVMVDAVSEYNAEQHVRIADARQAVIEAAKAFIAESPNTMVVPWHDLRRAVEALQAAEGEEQ